MDFEWAKEQRELYEAIVGFARKKLNLGDAEARDARSEFSREAWRLCAEQGLLGVNVEERFGGTGVDPLTGVYLMEALGYAADDLGLAFSLAAHVYACTVPIQKFGTPAQKEAWLPKLVSGEWIACHSITEADAGSDIFAMSMTATKIGEEYLLSGSKCFATNAPVADVFLVHAVTDASKGFFGLTAFLVERGTPGLTVGNAQSKIGLRTSPFGDLFFDECRVPIANRVGSEGAGAPVFTASMTWERTCLFAIYVGSMQRQLEEAIAYAKGREQFGQPIGKFQAVSHRIVDMKLRLEAARLLLYKSAWKIAKGKEDRVDAGLAKLFISEAAVQSGLDIIQIHGGAGVLSGRIERYLRDAVPCRLFSGTNDIQRNNLAKALGL